MVQSPLDSQETPVVITLKEIFEKNLKSLADSDPEGLAFYDLLNHNRFKQIFSGYRGVEINRYFDERIKFAITDEDRAFVLYPSSFR